MMRLDKFLTVAGVGTRSEVKKLIKAGLVTVDGQMAGKPEHKVDEQTAGICVKGQLITYQEFTYLVLHKPAGYLTARTDANAKTVMELVPKGFSKDLSPVGRLDKDTEGLLLITDDGALNHRLMSPAHHVAKTYYAVVDHEIPADAVEQFAQGIDIGDDKPTKPAELVILPSEELTEAFVKIGGAAHAELTLTEGRYHQVKRMLGSLGCKVLYLKRLTVGGLTLGDLPKGACRELTPEELECLKAD